MSIFGDETITVGSESPDETGQEEQTAVSAENNEEESIQEPVHSDNSNENANERLDDERGEESPDETGQDNDLIAGKFKSMDEFVKAYRNLEKQYTQERQNKGQPPATTSQQQSSEQPVNDMNDRFWSAMEKNPMGTLQSIVGMMVKQQTAPIYEQHENQKFTSNFSKVVEQYPQLGSDEGMQTFIQKLDEIATDVGRPDLVRNPTPRMLRMAAEEAFGPQSKAEIYNRGKAAAREENERTRTKQTLGAPKGARKPETPQLTEEDEIKAGIMKWSRSGGGIL